jgi:hypothetical protein
LQAEGGDCWPNARFLSRTRGTMTFLKQERSHLWNLSRIF